MTGLLLAGNRLQISFISEAQQIRRGVFHYYQTDRYAVLDELKIR